MKNLPHTQAALKRRKQLMDALLELMRTKSYVQISVADICREASIPRRTFYHYFDCKEAVVDAVIEDMLSECFLAVLLEFDRGYEIMRESLIRNFRYWQGPARQKLDLLLENGLSGEMMHCALRWLDRERMVPARRPDMSEKDSKIVTMVGASGFFTLLMYWCRNNYRETPEEIAEYALWILSKPLYPL